MLFNDLHSQLNANVYVVHRFNFLDSVICLVRTPPTCTMSDSEIDVIQ